MARSRRPMAILKTEGTVFTANSFSKIDKQDDFVGGPHEKIPPAPGTN